jgi:hypothetical protein
VRLALLGWLHKIHDFLSKLVMAVLSWDIPSLRLIVIDVVKHIVKLVDFK